MTSAKAEGLTLRAAVYARKSTDDDRNDQDKSVTRQIEHAKDYAKKKGWAVDGEYVFSDDGVSGAEFENRPGFARLLGSIPKRGRPPFDVLIVSEVSRLGRDAKRMGFYLAGIHDAGVRIFSYLTDEEECADTPEQVLMSSVKSYTAEVERLKAGQRSRDALERKAKAGYNAGGVVYGYDNVPIMVNETKSHTEYRVNDKQARVVRAMFRMYADGHGAKVIAYCVNGDPAHRPLLKRYFDGERPTAPRGGATWSSGTIHDLLRNPRYLGFIPYGATRKRYIGGTKRRVRGEEHLYPAPSLRIVDEAMERRVKERAERMSKVYLRAANGRLGGRPESGRASRYLLSGLVRCEECGAAMIVSAGSAGSGKKRRQIRHYVCSGRSNRGPTVCSNGVRPRLDDLDREALKAIGHHISPAVVGAAARRAVELIRARNAAAPDKRKELQAGLKAADTQAEHLAAAIESGGKLEALLAKLTAAEARRAALRKELAEVESPPLLDELGDKRLERRLAERATHWREVLAGDVGLVRQALRALLAGPIAFAPEAKGGYRLRGATKLGALFSPDQTRVKMASPGGFEPPLPP